MNTQKNLNFVQNPLCPSFTQLLIKFSQMNFLRLDKNCQFNNIYFEFFLCLAPLFRKVLVFFKYQHLYVFLI